MNAKIHYLVFLFTALLFVLFVFNLDLVYAGDNIWTPHGLYGVRVVNIAVDPENNLNIFAATSGSGGMYKSTDAGLTWKSVFPGWDWDMDIVFDPTNSMIMYVNTYYHLFKSIDGGDTWNIITTPSNFDIYEVVISPTDKTLYLSGAFLVERYSDLVVESVSLLKSTDGGATWKVMALPPTLDFGFSHLVMAPSAPNIFYLATALGHTGIFKSLDRGETWQSLNSSFAFPPIVYSLEVDPNDANRVYIGTADSSIFRTEDGGLTWTPIGSGLETNCIHDILIDPGNQQMIYVGGGTPFYFPSSPGTPGVYRSTDNIGNSWESFMNGMGSRAIFDLAIDRGTPRTLYAGTDEGGVWKYTLVSGPDDYGISINNGALFTNQEAVTLTLTAPAGTTEMMISNDGGFAGSAWEPFSGQKQWTLTAYGNYVLPRLVYSKFKTGSQVSGLFLDDIVLDINPPTGSLTVTLPASDHYGSLVDGSSLPIKNSASESLIYLPIIAKNYHPGFRLVWLDISARDDLSGVESMMVANTPTFDGENWQRYQTGMEWWALDKSSPTIYIRFIDYAGNVSAVISANLTP